MIEQPDRGGTDPGQPMEQAPAPVGPAAPPDAQPGTDPGARPAQGSDPDPNPDPSPGPGPDAARPLSEPPPGSDPQRTPATLPAAPTGPATPTDAPDKPFPIVGIGASAGGLAAFDAFLSALPGDADTGMAFVLVQHLSPDHKSILSELCRRLTRMPVHEIRDEMVARPDRVYIIPPNSDMALLDGHFHLLEPAAPRGMRLPIDFFFRSLARECQERSICVVLSGTGSDGTLGARAIKGAGGLVIAQTPETAGYDGMPRSVIATGLTDFVLPPAEMPARILNYVAHAFGRLPRVVGDPGMRSEDASKKICILLRDRTGHDFSQYKQSTLIRRIERRMALHRIERQSDYVRFLQHDPGETEALFRDLLIGVTSFFRDPEAFATLETAVVPRLFAGKPAGATVRVWVCGCSTGEEAYSLAILLQEHLENLRQGFKVQIFATDVDPGAVDQARKGIYPASIAADLSSERLARHFLQEGEDGAYRVQKVIRDLLVFSEQDLIRDPPFSRMDLISCRNLLIYMNSDLQKRLIPLFHYALSPEGVLFLGTSETVGDAPTLFAPLSRKWKIYTRLGHPAGTPAQVLGELIPPPRDGRTEGTARPAEAQRDGRSDLALLTERALLAHFAPVAILVNARGEILHIYGRTGNYLEPAPGDATMSVLAMAREGLRRDLTMALHRAVARKETIRCAGLQVRSNGDLVLVDLTVRPAEGPRGTIVPDLFLVVLEPARSPPAPAAQRGASGGEGTAGAPLGESDARIAELELALRSKEEYLQGTLEEMETSNEELKSANEEMQSVNEELQSTNEELETSKEELQSVNEELATVNVELQTKVADLSRANNDMNNLLAGTGVATLFVDHRLRITRFTPAATQLIKLIQTDVGRPVGDIVSNLLDYDRLVEDAHGVLKTLASKEQEVQTRSGGWYLMRIGPYRTLENVIEGAVITFVEITARKETEARLHRARAYAEAVVDALPQAILVLDPELRVLSANRAYCRSFGQARADARGRALRDLGNGQWPMPESLLAEVAAVRDGGAALDGYRMTLALPTAGERTLEVRAQRLAGRPGVDGVMVLMSFDEVDGQGAPGGAPARSADTSDEPAP